MLAAIVVEAVVAAAVVVLLYHGIALVFAFEMPQLKPNAGPMPPREVGRQAKVSVVVAARNEELDLPAALDSLLAQDYPNYEVIVVDGGSTDGTRAIIDARAPRVRRIDEPPLPPGWVGKSWACWHGARATDGEWILFCDADVRLDPRALRTTVDWAERESASLASIALEVEMVGFWERVVLPFYSQMVLTYFRAPHVNRPRSRSAMANGQYTLVRRTDYDATDGHRAVRASILEDVALARRFRAAGKTLRMAWAPELGSTRMYRDRNEMFEGIRKTVHGTEFSAARQVGFLAGLIAFFWLPLVVLPVGIVEGSAVLTLVGAVLAVALFGKHLAFTHAVRAPAIYGFGFPLATGFYLVAVASSLGRGLRGGSVGWKGRSYPLRP